MTARKGDTKPQETREKQRQKGLTKTIKATQDNKKTHFETLTTRF